jgi:hypothetical protein
LLVTPLKLSISLYGTVMTRNIPTVKSNTVSTVLVTIPHHNEPFGLLWRRELLPLYELSVFTFISGIVLLYQCKYVILHSFDF